MPVGPEIVTSNASLLGLFTLLATLGVTLAKVIDFLIKKVLPQKKILSEEEFKKIEAIYSLVESVVKSYEEKTEKIEERIEEQHDWVRVLFQQHSKVDADGIPLWYVPRSFIETQKEIVSILLNISSQMDKSTYILDSLLKRIEEVERQLRSNDKK